MVKNSYKGRFIIFEGLDGSGQSTQAALLEDFLIKKGLKVLLTKEPTLSSPAGRRIRKILDKKEKISPKNLQLLFAKDRKEHLKKTVIPALKRGTHVISDRYFFSSFAYGASGGLDLQWLFKINDNFLLPDIAFILKVRPAVCIKRIEKRGSEKTLFEKKKSLEKVWKIYEILPRYFKNAYIIKGEDEIERVFGQVKKIFKKLR